MNSTNQQGEGTPSPEMVKDILIWHDGPVAYLAKGAAIPSFFPAMSDADRAADWLVQVGEDNEKARKTSSLVVPVSPGEARLLKEMSEDVVALLPHFARIYQESVTGWVVTESWDGDAIDVRSATKEDFLAYVPSDTDPAPAVDR